MEADDFRTSPVYSEFFDHISKEFNLIFFVMGNHEYWGGNIRETLYKMRDYVPANVVILDNEGYNVHREDGTSVTFFGGTMWTNFSRGSPAAIMAAGRMKDLKYIDYSDPDSYFWSKDESGQTVRMNQWSKFNDYFWVKEHELFLQKADERIHGETDVVVITHHSPSYMSISPEFKNDIFGNDSYASDLSEFILDRPQIKHWIHGHIHHKQMHYIGDCLVRANPRGYCGHEATNNFKLEYFDI